METVEIFQRISRAESDYTAAQYEIARLCISLEGPMDHQSAPDVSIRLDSNLALIGCQWHENRTGHEAGRVVPRN